MIRVLIIFSIFFPQLLLTQVNLSISTLNYRGQTIKTTTYDGDYSYQPKMTSAILFNESDEIIDINISISNTNLYDTLNPSLKLSRFDLQFETPSDFENKDSIFYIKFIISKNNDFEYASNKFYILKNIYQQSIKLISPENNSNNISVLPTFNWLNDNYKLLSYYQIRVSKDIELNNPIVNEFTSNNSYTLNNKLEPETKYYWGIRKPIDKSFKFETIFSFTTGYDTTWSKINTFSSSIINALTNSSGKVALNTPKGLFVTNDDLNSFSRIKLTTDNERIVNFHKIDKDTVYFLGINFDLPEPKFFLARSNDFCLTISEIKYFDNENLNFQSTIFITDNTQLLILTDSSIISYSNNGFGNRIDEKIINNSLNKQIIKKPDGNLLLFTSKGAEYYDYCEIFESKDFGNSWNKIFDYEGYYGYNLVSGGLSDDGIIYASYKNHSLDEGYIIFSSDHGKSFNKLNKRTFYYITKFLSVPNGNLYLLKENIYDQVDYSGDNCNTIEKYDHNLSENVKFTDLLLYKDKYLLAFNERGEIFKRQVRNSGEVPLFPSDTSLFQKTINFRWPINNDAMNYHFQLWSKSKTFILSDEKINFIADDSLIINNNVTFNIDENLEFNWRFRAKTNYGWTYWSDVFTFNTITTDVEYKRVLSKDISISPNPAREFIEISGLNKGFQPLVQSNEIRIYNILGECVLTVEQVSLYIQRIDISNLPQGIYFVRCGGWMGRFVKVGN